MQIIDLTLESPEANLALDEALLDHCEAGHPSEILRFWESPDVFVVAGYSNKIHREVNVPYCRGAGIPILRRSSGGGTVLQGPGCLNYALILDIRKNPCLESIRATNTYIMERNARALSRAAQKEFCVRGHTDLADGPVKFSGNAQRRRRNFLLFHGTFLIDFDMPLISRALQMPSSQPDYRENRSHEDFVRNLNLDRELIKRALGEEWLVSAPLENPPLEAVERLIREQYANPAWVEKF
ncbi:MAG: lipoate--protein ligase family protein [Candidatus Omnitrophica bacterium]|nr:lipoate--protein ligase family protein [Candidatus Omnitrophota bacterium]